MARLMSSSLLKFPILRYDSAQSTKSSDDDLVVLNDSYGNDADDQDKDRDKDQDHSDGEQRDAHTDLSPSASIISDGPTFSRRSSIDFELIDDDDSASFSLGALSDSFDGDEADERGIHELQPPLATAPTDTAASIPAATAATPPTHETTNYDDSQPRDHTVPQTTYPRISRPVELLRPSYDCVVIGSGYGGSVAASRMARAGQSVCLLERGEERWPGEYPTTAREAAEQFHFSGEFEDATSDVAGVEGGNPTGLYHLIFGRGQSAMVGNGELPSFITMPHYFLVPFPLFHFSLLCPSRQIISLILSVRLERLGC